jgi:hypothetical protein
MVLQRLLVERRLPEIHLVDEGNMKMALLVESQTNWNYIIARLNSFVN